MSSTDFDHFAPDLFIFLRELADHNERPWFEKQKRRYESEVRGPALDFVRAMGERLPQISAHMVADDRKVGGSLMRIHKDVRFSKDKRPYKTNVGMHFRLDVGKDVHAPGLYLHLEPGQCFVGAGLWRPEREALDAIRTAIDSRQAAFRAVVSDPKLTAVFNRDTSEGLKRPPRGYAKDHPLVEDLKLTSHTVGASFPDADATTPGFIDRVSERYAAAAPFMAFLCKSIGVAW
ncbi:MAG: TIGR02453 family protein [Myxococcota bacterium]